MASTSYEADKAMTSCAAVSATTNSSVVQAWMRCMAIVVSTNARLPMRLPRAVAAKRKSSERR